MTEGDAQRSARSSADYPIFIVGASRSGTNLLRAAMNKHSTLWISGETHYFDDLRTRLDPHAALLDGEAERCENYFRALEHRPYGQEGQPDAGDLNLEELRAEAHALGGHADAYFEGFCRLRARRNDKRRWGEKTPRHVFRIGEILDAFPSAKIICLVRDPRAVAASYRDWHLSKRGEDKSSEDREALSSDRERAPPS